MSSRHAMTQLLEDLLRPLARVGARLDQDEMKPAETVTDQEAPVSDKVPAFVNAPPGGVLGDSSEASGPLSDAGMACDYS